jgi:hypothetical protein
MVESSGESVPPTESAAPAIPPPPPTATPFPSYERTVCGDKPTMVALLVDPRLAASLRAGIDQFEADLCTGGYGIVERTLDFPTPPDVRAYLSDLYSQSARKLEGAIFIGRVPLPYQSFGYIAVNPDVPLDRREMISFQYYSDLDGEFTRSPDFKSPGGHEFSFDRHTGETDWEIWTAVLPLYRDDEALTVAALTRYFSKNHLYRSGRGLLPDGFLLITEHYIAKTAAEQADFFEVLRTGQYAWTPLSSAPGAQFYFNGPTLLVRDGYAALSGGVADITVTETHGDHTMSGMIDIGWVESRPVRTVLYWTGGCSVGNLEYPENFLTAIVYSQTSEVLAAYGSTEDSGGVGTNGEGFYGHNVAVRLAAGENLGRAFLGHINVPLIYPWNLNREYHFAPSIFIGDPTLRFRNKEAHIGV